MKIYHCLNKQFDQTNVCTSYFKADHNLAERWLSQKVASNTNVVLLQYLEKRCVILIIPYLVQTLTFKKMTSLPIYNFWKVLVMVEKGEGGY